MPARKVDFIFEDLDHRVETVRRVWSAFQDKAKKEALIVSHDAAHRSEGTNVRLGIVASGVLEPEILAIEPADCGLAVWRKP